MDSCRCLESGERSIPLDPSNLLSGLGGFGLLLLEYGLHSFLLFSEVFILEQKLIDGLHVEIEITISVHLVHLLGGFLLEGFVLLGTFLDQFVDIDLTQQVDFVDFLFHDGGCSVDKNFLVFFF